MTHRHHHRLLLTDQSFECHQPTCHQPLTTDQSFECHHHPTATGRRWNPRLGGVSPEDHGTSHLAVLDAAGNAATLTTTVNTGFGSNLISRWRRGGARTGFF